MLLLMFLSFGASTVASAHEGDGDHCCAGWGHGWGWGWGHGWRGNDYIYGQDGMYARHRDGKACCDKDAKPCCSKEAKEEEGKCANHCWGAPTFRKAYYHEDMWGDGHLSFEGHKSCCDKKEKEDNDK